MSFDGPEGQLAANQRFALQIEYDGTNFCGWQVQKSDRTVQGEIETGLAKLYGQKLRITGAGRTDSGVHAAGQIAHFDAGSQHDAGTIKRALNFYLPEDVKIISCWLASPDFHARFSAQWRYYIYRVYKTDKALFRQYGWCPREQVDFARLNETAELFLGDHEFTAFCAADAVDDHHHCLVRQSCWIELADEYQYHIVANRFLKHMVRMLVGVTIDVSRGRFPAQQIRDFFKTNQKGNLVLSAPPQGLFLMRVGYGEFPYVDLEQKQTQSFP